MTELNRLAEIVEDGLASEVGIFVESLLNHNVSPEDIINEGIMVGLNEVGRKFEEQEIYISEMMLAARTAKIACEKLKKNIPDTTKLFNERKMLIGTVQGDLHDIGKNLVSTSMVGVGINVLDLGVDVPVSQFVSEVTNDPNIKIVGVSALLTNTLPAMERTVKALKTCSVSDRFVVMVGGLPVTKEYAKRIGADVYTETAFQAARVAREILEGTYNEYLQD